MSYSEKYKDPRWQKKRLECLNRAQFECQHCEADDKTLHVHHRYYVKGRNPWEYPLWALQSLCKDCHKLFHDYERDEDESPIEEWENVLEFLQFSEMGEPFISAWEMGAEFRQRADRTSYQETFLLVMAALKAPLEQHDPLDEL